jgi:hypothetical protein
MKNENKNQRSVSASLKDNKSNKIKNQNIKEKENITNDKKGYHHRKRSSSYFLGSYIPDINLIENNYEEEHNINIDNVEKGDNENEKEETRKNEIQNKLIYNLINNEDSNNLSLSFPSYDEGNNNSVIIKKGDSTEVKQKDINNNIILELNEHSENSRKSFITFKNSLKYIKDKDERTTPSYQLALLADKKGGNNCYVTTSNIIEEEKSSMLESKTEFSNKKENILPDQEKKENKLLEYIKDININNWNIYTGKNEDKIRMSLALNEIIIKNNKKEEYRRKILTQNKMNLLNTFFTISKPLVLNQKKDDKIENIYKKEKNLNNPRNNKYLKNKVNNINDNFTKKKFVRKFVGKPLNCDIKNNNHALTDNETQKIEEINILNNENNLETENTKKNKSKIPHLSNMKKLNQKVKNDSPSNTLNNAPYKGFKTSNSNNSSSRSNSLLSKKLNKIFTKNDSRNNLHSMKRRENLNNALKFIKEKKRNKLDSDLEKGKYYNNNTYNYSKKINNATYTNSLTNSNLNTNNSNTQSHSKSKSKDKNLKLNRKSNSGSFNIKEEYVSNNGENYMNLECNLENTILCLRDKLLFNKVYEKVDVIEKIKSTCFPTKSFFVILCENKIDINNFIFYGLYKFYKDQEKFIKIYGDERSPNYILLKDITEQKKYNIFVDINVVNTFVNKFILTNHFKSTNNAVLIVKN